MLFASHNGSTSPVYDHSGPQLVGNRLTPTLVGTQHATLVGAPNVTLVGATASTAAAPSGPIPLQPPGRAPIDAQGRVAGTYSALDRARAILERTAVHRSADQLAMRPWQGGQLGSGIDPTQFAPGAVAAATRTGVVGWGVMSPQAPMWWRPDATYKTSVLEPSAIRTTNPVQAARQVINPFIGSARSIAPGIASWPGSWPVYRTYVDARTLDPSSYPGAGTSPTSTPCATCTYSPSVSVEQRGTVPAATPAAAPTNRSAFGFWRA